MKKQKEKDEKHAEAAKRRTEKRNEAFIPPEEPSTSKKEVDTEIDVAALKEKILKARKGSKLFNKSNV